MDDLSVYRLNMAEEKLLSAKILFPKEDAVVQYAHACELYRAVKDFLN